MLFNLYMKNKKVNEYFKGINLKNIKKKQYKNFLKNIG